MVAQLKLGASKRDESWPRGPRGRPTTLSLSDARWSRRRAGGGEGRFVDGGQTTLSLSFSQLADDTLGPAADSDAPMKRSPRLSSSSVVKYHFGHFASRIDCAKSVGHVCNDARRNFIRLQYPTLISMATCTSRFARRREVVSAGSLTRELGSRGPRPLLSGPRLASHNSK